MTDKRLPVGGGCLWGAVRYESSEPPDDGGCCHCGMCRKATGGLLFSWLSFPDGALRITRGKVSHSILAHRAGWFTRPLARRADVVVRLGQKNSDVECHNPLHPGEFVQASYIELLELTSPWHNRI